MTPEKRPQDPYMDGSGKHNNLLRECGNRSGGKERQLSTQHSGIEVDDALQIAEQVEPYSSNPVKPSLPHLPLGEGNIQRVEYGLEHVPNNRF